MHPGPQMGQESFRGLKRVAQGVQKVPKGFQKVAKSREKDIQKASTRHPNAIRKCIGNSVGNSLSNAIANAIANAIGNRRPLRSMKTNTRTGWLGGTDNLLRSDFFLAIILLLYTKYWMKMYTVLSTVRHRPILDNINNSITTYMQNSIRRGTMTGGKLIKCTNALLPIVCAVTDHGTVAGRPKANG